jgi:anti-sigma regulatory factor (Ser/Thr protein kinase)
MTVEVPTAVPEPRDHVVRFYEDDRELVAWVGSVVLDAVGSGDAAIVIATEAHRRGLAAHAESAGVDLAAARRDGRYAALDAAATLAEIMPGGRLQAKAFERVVGERVRAAVATGRPVHAFGEMVALLWDAGDVPAAIELERMWNELGRELPFTLLCAYRHAAVSNPEQAAALEQVCFLHSAVHHMPRGEITGRFAAARDAPCAARHFALDVLAEWRIDGTLRADAQLIATELATNAVIHGHSPFTLTIALEDAYVRIAVEDRSTALPERRDAGPTAKSGRGLTLVRALSSRWGVDTGAHGKTVWAELPFSGPA